MKDPRTTAGGHVDVAVPVLKKPVTASEFLVLLRSRLDSMNLPRIRHNDRMTALRRLEEYLAAVPHEPLVVNEDLMGGFEQWMLGGDTRRCYRRQASSAIRSLVNSLPDGLRNRRLLTMRETKRLTRFDCFSPETKNLLERFLLDGRKVKRTPGGLAPTSVTLSHSARQNAVYAATMIMRLLDLDDVRNLDRERVEEYLDDCGEDGRDTAIHTLWNMRCMFRWLLATGAVGEDPLAGIGQQKACVDSDYVPGDEMAKIADLSTLDMSDFVAVRNRLIAYALCYDCALRVGEAAGLRLDDVRINGFVEISLRGEVQKGSAKPTMILRNLLPESKTLFEAYLRLRLAMNVDTGALLVSEHGQPLLASGCRNAVKRVCAELEVTTRAGRIPAPHRFRHSLGTLNVGELGMKLTPYYLMRRYRHNDIRTTMQVYVTSNPLLDEAQHVAIVNAALGNGNGHVPEADPRPKAMASDIVVPEVDAMAKIRSLGVNWRSLRDHAMALGAAVDRQGRVCYSKSFLDRLCTEWMTRDEAMRLMGITAVSAYQYRARNHGIETLVIGKASLAKTSDVIRSLRLGDPHEG